MTLLATRTLLAGLGLGLAGCWLFIPEETTYLRSAKDHATQQEVHQRLGQPVLTDALPSGESIWVYHVRVQEPGSQSSRATAGSWCDEYVLTFDPQGILRQWTNQSERHGGETYALDPCVREGYRSATAKLSPGVILLEPFKK